MRIKLELLTDEELIASLRGLVGDERRTVAAVLRRLNEFDRRRLAAGRGFPSLFEYCVRELKYAQGEAARRIHAARAAEKYPVIYKAIERGLLSLTAVSILAPHLKWDNYRKLIRASKGRSTREIEALVADCASVPAPRERIRFMSVLPAVPDVLTSDLFSPSVEPAPVELPAAIETALPVLPAVRRVEFTFTGDEALLRDYERAKELSRHKWPAGKMEDVFAGAKGPC